MNFYSGLLRLSENLWLEGEFKNGKMHGKLKYVKVEGKEIEYEINFKAKNGIINGKKILKNSKIFSSEYSKWNARRYSPTKK